MYDEHNPHRVRIRKGGFAMPEMWLDKYDEWTADYAKARMFSSQEAADRHAEALGMTNYGVF